MKFKVVKYVKKEVESEKVFNISHQYKLEGQDNEYELNLKASNDILKREDIVDLKIVSSQTKLPGKKK